jgi:hypothetical protein
LSDNAVGWAVAGAIVFFGTPVGDWVTEQFDEPEPTYRTPTLYMPSVTFPRSTYPPATFPRATFPRTAYPPATFPRTTYPPVTFPSYNWPAVTYQPNTGPTWNGYDLDCADIGGTVYVGDYDPHGLDRDNDGWGCE